jgi:hypothetical protein
VANEQGSHGGDGSRGARPAPQPRSR